MSENYLVVGAGKSGVAAAELLLDMKKNVTIFEANKDFDEKTFRAVNGSLDKVPLVIGEMSDDDMKKFDEAVLSPGVPLDSSFSERLKAAGARITGEVELAFECGKGKLVAITGTNGKTTTTSLTGEIMKLDNEDVRVVGNIGNPYTKEAATETEKTVTVAEISSFQLETTDKFHPNVAAILNITPDHLNRHHTMEEYIRVKELITQNQTESDTLVLNYEDKVLRAFGEKMMGKRKVVFFSSKTELSEGFFIKDGKIVKAHDGKIESYLAVEELQILGPHNWENAMAAIAMTEAMGVPKRKIIEGLRNFTAVEHRIEYVCTKNGVKYYNDSKGTNPDAAIKAVEAMNGPICLIGGGYDKGNSYDEWVNSFNKRVKMIALIGQTKNKIAECCQRHGFMNFELCDTLEEAIDACTENAVPGDNVLLSPACASWDMFKNYEIRGQIFKEYVKSKI
jgi:UDP-N-acetylmuramoylalanine--D-glutamate ligase